MIRCFININTKYLFSNGILLSPVKFSPKLEVTCKYNSSCKLYRYDLIEGQARRSFPLKKPSLRVDGSEKSKYFLLVVPITAFCLGIWQIQRKAWKEGLIAEMTNRKNEKPVPLPENLEDLKNLEYYPVRVKGRFIHDKEIHLGPRSKLEKEGASNYSQGLISRSSTGFLIVTPFQLSDRNLTILVNRGWVPLDKMNPSLRQEGQITGEVELVGIVRLNEKRPQFSEHNNPAKNKWFYRDVTKMAEVTNSDPVFIDALASTTVPGGPIGGQTRTSLRNEHLSYILTWFGLSFGTGYFWYTKYIKKL